MIAYIFKNLKIRYLVSIILYCALSCAAYRYVNTGHLPSFPDIIVAQTNEMSIVCFALMYIFLLILGDVNTQNEYLRSTRRLISYITVNAALLMTLFILCNISTYLVLSGGEPDLLNLNITENQPALLLSFSILFVYLRIVFSGLLIALINTYSKNLMGFMYIILISIIDWTFYFTFRIHYPLGILPIEHTRITYTEALLPNVNDLPRPSFLLSILYWSILIAILIVLTDRRIKKTYEYKK